MRRILVTGGAGFIGGWLVRTLQHAGDDVAVLDVAPPADGARTIRASVLDAGAMHRHVRGVDAVVHLAGLVRDGMRAAPFDGATLQLQGTLNVLEACRVNGVPTVAFASSFYVYDGMPSDEVVDERSQLDPRTMELFGSTKLMGEALCHDFARNGGPGVSIFRIGPAYGGDGSSAVDEFVRTGLAGRPIEIWGRGERRNQYTWVGDLATAIATGMFNHGETYNLVAPEAVSLRELAGLLADDHGLATTFDESRPEGPSFPYISSKKAIDELRWEPLSLRDGLREVVQSVAARGA